MWLGLFSTSQIESVSISSRFISKNDLSETVPFFRFSINGLTILLSSLDNIGMSILAASKLLISANPSEPHANERI